MMKSQILKPSWLLCAFSLLPCIAFAHKTPSLAVTKVKATSEKQKIKSTPYSVSVITAKQIEESGASNISQAIMTILGIPGSMDLSGGNNYSLNLRSFGSANQLVLVDGQPITNDDLSSPNFNLIPIEDVEKIEVMRGIGAVQYGSGATGGVILITTKSGKGIKRQDHATLGASYGSFNTQNIYGSATLAKGGFSVDVAGKNQKSDGYRENFSNILNNLTATVQWSNDWLRLGAKSGRYMQYSGMPGSLTYEKYEQDKTQASTLNNWSKLKTQTGGVFGEAVFGDWTLSANANQRSTRNEAWYAPSTLYISDIDATDAHIKATHERIAASYFDRFTLGIDNGYWKNTRYGAFGNETVSNNNAVYALNDFTWQASQTLVNVGFRRDDVQKERTKSPVKINEYPSAWQLGVSQPLSHNVDVYGHAATSYRIPNADEFTFTSPNVMLKTQTSQDWELGMRWADEFSNTDVHWYRSNVTNEIGFDPNAPSPWGGKGANVNFDPAVHNGVEFSYHRQLQESLALTARYAWRQAYFASGSYAGNDLPGVPKNTVALGATWNPVIDQVLDVYINWLDKTKNGFANACAIPAYTTVNVHYGIKHENINWGVGVNNLFDTQTYFAQACSNGLPNNIYPAMGRSVTASVQVNF